MSIVEDFSVPIDNLQSFRVTDPLLPSNTFILFQPDSHRILTEPWIAGGELNQLIVNSARVMLDFVGAIGALDGVKRKNLNEVVFLRGGLGYALSEAYHEQTGYQHCMGRVFFGIQRFEDPENPQGWIAKAGYKNFEALSERPTIFICDTIASGATMKKGVELLFDEINQLNKTKKVSPEKLIIYSLCCSYEGAKRIREMEDKLHDSWPELKVYLIVSDGLFHAMPDRTDLRYEFDRAFIQEILPEDFDKESPKSKQSENTAIVPKEVLDSVREKWGSSLLKLWHDVAGDWGNRIMCPDAHYKQNMFKAEELLKRNTTRKKKFLGPVEEEFLNRVIEECGKRLDEREKTIA